MRNKGILANIDNSDPTNYPNGRIQNNTGSGNGTPVNEFVKGDLHEFFDKCLRLYGISHNGLPDNETNGYQTIEAVKSLASKNDYTLPLTTASNVMSVGVKLGRLLNNESFVLKSGFDLGTETTIKGSDNVTKSVTFVGTFKANEYVRMINTASTVVLVRLVDAFNLDVATNELNYLKKATGAETIAGTIDTKAVTPESFLEAFAEYVLGTESDNFLATIARNGLYPKEHFEIVENIAENPVKNVGGFSGLDVDTGTVGSTYPVFGDVVSATVQSSGSNASVIAIVLSNAMPSTDYFVRVHIKSENTGAPTNDRTMLVPSTKEYTTTSFEFQIAELSGVSQNLRITFEVVTL